MNVRAPCNDGMSQVIDPLDAQVWVNGEDGPGLQGCAETVRSIQRRNAEDDK